MQIIHNSNKNKHRAQVMIKREEVNKEEIKQQGLTILPTKVEYDSESNEIWVFGQTQKRQTVMVRVTQYNSVFFVSQKIIKQSKENKVEKLKQLITSKFKKSEINITETTSQDSTIYKVILEYESLQHSDLESQIEGINFSKQDLFTLDDVFVPNTRDQFILDQGINSKTFLSFKVDGKQNVLLEEPKPAKKGTKKSGDQKISNCSIEVLCKNFEPTKSFDNKLHKEISQNQVILITDIENLVLESGFDAEKIKKNPIFMISNLIFKNGENTCTKQIFTTSDKMNIDKSVDVKYFKTELEMLISWFDELYQIDPDVITGFNVLKFDLSFLHLRAKHLIEQGGEDYETISFGRVPTKKLDSKVVADLFQNKSYFNLKEDTEIFETTGRQVIDCSWYFNHTHPFVPANQRRLKDWAKRYLNEDSQKLDIAYDQFSEYLYSKDIEKRSLLGKYNIRDSEIVQELFLKFDFLGYYSDMSYLNDTLTQQYHDKSFFPIYFKKLTDHCITQDQIELSSDCLVIKNNQSDQWDRIQEYVSHLQRLQKVEFNIDHNTSPLIFKQIIKLQENLHLENISFKLKDSISNLSFQLSPLIQNLHQAETKVVSIQTNSDIKNQEIDLIDSLLYLPPSLTFLYIQIHQTTQLQKSKDSIKKLKAIKSTLINKIVINFNEYSEPSYEFAEVLGQFVKMQTNLEAVDLVFQYNSINMEFIQNVIKQIASNSSQMKNLNLTIKGNEEIKKNTTLKETKKSSQFLEDVLRHLERELVCIERIFLTFADIKLNTLNDAIFSTFGKRLSTLKLFVFKIEEEKKFLKSNFYNMIRSFKERQ